MVLGQILVTNELLFHMPTGMLYELDIAKYSRCITRALLKHKHHTDKSILFLTVQVQMCKFSKTCLRTPPPHPSPH